MPTSRISIRDASVVVFTVGMGIVGTIVIFSPGPAFWFRVGLGVFLYGQVLLRLALSKSWSRARAILGLSTVRGMQLWSVAHIAAGCLFIIGAVSSLHPAFAAIVAFGAFCWIWMWGWFLGQSRKWIEPNAAEAGQAGMPPSV